jgi:H+/Cl- antiporter ClcA
VFGLSISFIELGVLPEFDLSHVLYLVLLGVLLACAVGLFDASISFVNKISKKVKKQVKNHIKLVFVFVITGVLALTFSDGVYSGHHVIEELVHDNKILSVVFALLIVRVIMMLFITDTGATGGIFIPTLAIGALVGTLLAKLLIAMGMNAQLYQVVVLLSMCAFIGGTLRAPLTATVLFIELTGQFTNLFYVALVVFIVYVITELINMTPFYDRVLHNMEERENKGKKYYNNLFEVQVAEGSFAVGKTVRDIMWPTSTIVLRVKHAGEMQNFDGNVGDKVLFANDTLYIKASYSDERKLFEYIHGIVGEDSQINVTKW